MSEPHDRWGPGGDLKCVGRPITDEERVILSKSTANAEATLGGYVRVHRVEAGLSLRDVAQRIGCSAVYLGEVERGKRLLGADLWSPLVEAVEGIQLEQLELLHAPQKLSPEELVEALQNAIPKRVAKPEDLCRLVSCEQWEWMPGMLVSDARVPSPYYVLEVDADGHRVRISQHVWWSTKAPPPLLPILNNPATVGCMLDMLIRHRGCMLNRALDMLDEAWHDAAASELGDLLALILLEEWS